MDIVDHLQNRSLEFAMVLTLPAAVALVVMATPVIAVLFQRASFGASDTEETAAALAAFAVGLPAFVLVKVFSPGFFAREDTRTPMIFAGVSVATNVALCRTPDSIGRPGLTSDTHRGCGIPKCASPEVIG
jgi:putative peptidoglycan lipid II flippase